MDDLISRQAAIEYCYALINAENPRDPSDEWNYSQERINQTEVILHHLEFMPSAQPEAKPPKWVAEDRYVKNRFAVFPHCPQCYAEVTTGQCYCMICGQHIDWSEDDG